MVSEQEMLSTINIGKMGVSFFTKSKGNIDNIPVHCSVNFQGMDRFTFRVNNINVNKKDWSEGRMITGKGKIENGRTQSILENLQKKIEEYFQEFLMEFEHTPSKDEIFHYLKSEKKLDDYIRPEKVINIVPEIGNVISKRKNGQDLNMGSMFGEATIKSYGNFYNNIKEFEIFRKEELNSKNILNEETIYEFQTYLTTTLKYQLNTVGQRMKHLNTFLQVLKRKKIIVLNPFIEFEIPIPVEDTVSIALTEEEMEEMENLDLSFNPTYEKVRDQFLLMCWTGLRISDFRSFIDIPKIGSIISIINKKTRQTAHIPLFPQARRIIDKYDGNLPKLISEQKMRDYIKEIGCGVQMLTNKVEVEYTKGGKRVKILVPRYSLLGLHTSRRTLATTLYRQNVSLEEIMLITGHRKISSLKRYLKVTESEVLLNVLKKVEDRFNKTLQIV